MNMLLCIFGCDEGSDSLHHYLRCEILWTLVYTCANSNNAYVLSQSLPERFCLCNTSPVFLMRLYSATATYHKLRKLHSETVENAISLNDWSEVYDVAMQLIKTYCADFNFAT